MAGKWKQRAKNYAQTVDWWRIRAEHLEHELYLLKKEVAEARAWAEEAESARARTHCSTCQCIHEECGYVYLSLACCDAHGELHADG